jgi:site-specific DNA recombinase
MKDQTIRRSLRGAIYTRVSTEQGLEQDFNSLDAQREACEAYIKSQAHEGWRLVRDRYDDGGFSGGSMDRPALQKLLIDVQARRIDVIVVYKVDRLTRSLADFAKLVETFDAHGVSFVSVTQSFNTTTSMGRLTLNVLLSFAQFEREVTGERIRDKIAASKKKGIWMGGVVPLGYRVEDRALHVVEDHAEIVRFLFRRYLEAGSVVRLKQQLDAEGVRIPIRIDRGGRSTGGGLLSRGHVYRLLSNPIYVGRIAHKGQVHEGQHPPIVPQELWEQVQRGLRDHLGAARTKRTHQSSDALLAGKLFDDRGNRMSPTWARKGSKRWRYYASQAALQGDKSKAGSIVRVPAADVETLVAVALGKLSPDHAAPQTDIRNLIDSVVIGRTTIRIQFSEVAEGTNCARILTLPWTRPSPYRKARDHPGRKRCEDLRPPGARERACDPD